jgi:hypothetical protein
MVWNKFFEKAAKKLMTGKPQDDLVPIVQDDYMVDCCNAECEWQGLKSQALRWKHDTGDIICPECHEVCEPHEF